VHPDGTAFAHQTDEHEDPPGMPAAIEPAAGILIPLQGKENAG
jgi:hypothetical protein